MNEIVRCGESTLESTVSDIVQKDFSIFFDPNVNGRFNRAWAGDMIRNTKRKLVDLPKGIIVYTSNFSIINGGNTVLRDIDLLLRNDVLIPLGTHVNSTGKYKAYQLNQLCEVGSEYNLNDFLLDTLPETITLTRTLSSKEVAKYSEGPEGLGSTHQLFWTDIIHTAVHNVTDEFTGKGYERAIKFLFPKSELKHLLSDGFITFGTYSFIFSERAVDSPFPFDLEINFRRGGFPALIQAYNRWTEIAGVNDIPNPFFVDEL